MFATHDVYHAIRRASLLALLAVASMAPAYAAGPYGDCDVLFVAGKAPQAPSSVAITCNTPLIAQVIVCCIHRLNPQPI